MTQVTDAERRGAFAHWIRTGRLPVARGPDGIELKFNPWHDPDDGRFTFAGTGRHFAGGMRGWMASGRIGGQGSRQSRHRDLAARPAAVPISPAESHKVPQGNESATNPRGSWTGGGFTGGGGGSGGGAGATVIYDAPDPAVIPKRADPVLPAMPSSTRLVRQIWPLAPSPAKPVREVKRNGYVYAIDDRGRTRRVTGALTLTASPTRSRRLQAGAGGADRRTTDDGGHYIAARFNGPTEAFNHFAQDAGFNRGNYRRLEDGWAAAKRAGKKVTVRIVPSFVGSSMRPSRINVWYVIDGERGSESFPNEKQEKSRGR